MYMPPPESGAPRDAKLDVDAVARAVAPLFADKSVLTYDGLDVATRAAKLRRWLHPCELSAVARRLSPHGRPVEVYYLLALELACTSPSCTERAEQRRAFARLVGVLPTEDTSKPTSTFFNDLTRQHQLLYLWLRTPLGPDAVTPWRTVLVYGTDLSEAKAALRRVLARAHALGIAARRGGAVEGLQPMEFSFSAPGPFPFFAAANHHGRAPAWSRRQHENRPMKRRVRRGEVKGVR